MSKKINKNYALAESALMAALSIALFAVSDSLPWPFLYGGGFSLFGQVPIILVSYRHGIKYGLASSTVLALFEMIMGFKNFSYVTGLAAYLIVALADYIIAFGCLGLGGMFKNRFNGNAKSELVVGGLVVCLIRFICHFISGITVWQGYCPEGQLVAIYSLTYNGSYMLIETIITLIGLIAMGNQRFMKEKKM